MAHASVSHDCTLDAYGMAINGAPTVIVRGYTDDNYPLLGVHMTLAEAATLAHKITAAIEQANAAEFHAAMGDLPDIDAPVAPAEA